MSKNGVVKTVLKHLKEDDKGFRKSIKDDEKLKKKLKKKGKKCREEDDD